MSALTRLLGALWAAVWVRWRLLGVRVRRVLGGQPAAAVGAGYEIPVGEIPVEGVDYAPAELPEGMVARLGVVRAGLLDHARATTARRTRRSRGRRRRTVSLAVAALLTLSVLGAGATALVRGTTGVPAVDRLLGIYEKALDSPDPTFVPGPRGSEIQPRSPGDSASVSVGLNDGSTITSTAYVARSGDICVGLVDGDGSGATGDVNCVPPDQLRVALSTEEGMILGIRRYGRTVVLNGLVSGEVLDAEGRDRPIAVEFGEPWGQHDKLRPFIALGEGEANTFIRSSRFALRVRTSGGSSDIVP